MKKSDFLNSIEKFLQKHSLAATALGLDALKDSSFVWRLREGRECREKTQEKVLRWMENFECSAGGEKDNES